MVVLLPVMVLVRPRRPLATRSAFAACLGVGAEICGLEVWLVVVASAVVLVVRDHEFRRFLYRDQGLPRGAERGSGHRYFCTIVIPPERRGRSR